MCIANVGSRWDPTGILAGSDAISWDPPRLARDFAWEGRYFSAGSVSTTFPLYNIKRGKPPVRTQNANDARLVAHVLEFYLAVLFLEFYLNFARAVATFAMLKKTVRRSRFGGFAALAPPLR